MIKATHEAGRPELAPAQLSDCDRAVIEIVLATPRAAFGGEEAYADLPLKAAVLLYSLAKSQACPDGNKRIAVVLVEAFLALNGCTLISQQGELADVVLRAANSDREQRDAILDDLTAWLRPRITILDERGR